MTANTVLGVYEQDQLPATLAQLHRAGYGPNIRVLDASRGSLAGQIERAGIENPPTIDSTAQIVVMVFAPGRVAQVADLFQQTGCRAIHIVTRPQSSEVSLLMRTFVQSPSPRSSRARSRSTTNQINPPAPTDTTSDSTSTD